MMVQCVFVLKKVRGEETMAHEVLQLKSVHETKDRGYSHVAKVGKTLYLAGQVARDIQGRLVGKGDIETQARQVYTNLKNILQEAGGDLKHIVKTTTILTHYGNIEGYRKIRNEFFGDLRPPNTLLIVESLASPDFMMEVEAIAVLD